MKPSFLLFSLLTLASAGAWAQRQGYPQPSYPQQHYPQPPSVQITINPAPMYQQPYRHDSRADQWRRPPGWHEEAPGQRRGQRYQHPNEETWQRPPGWYDPPAGSRR